MISNKAYHQLIKKVNIMATIITKTANNLHDVKEMFAKYNRDNYPNAVYQFILDALESGDGDFVKVDVVGWACDISQTDLADTEFEDIEELYTSLGKSTTVIYEDGETVWHLC